MRKPEAILGIVALTLASTSCLRQKPLARVFIPPPARERPRVPDTIASLEQGPAISADVTKLDPPQLPAMGPELTEEIPDAPKRVARRPVQHPVEQPKPAIATTPDIPAPRLAQLFTPEEFKQNTRTLEESLGRVDRALTAVEGKTLTAEQKEMVERIRTYRKQAEQAKEQDLLTAVSLARRADLLAKDLLDRLP
jgi:hypothetical protein